MFFKAFQSPFILGVNPNEFFPFLPFPFAETSAVSFNTRFNFSIKLPSTNAVISALSHHAAMVNANW